MGIHEVMENLLNQGDLHRSVLILRHAERPEITDPTHAETTLLTPEGVVSARCFGIEKLFVTPPQRIFHSTIPRCRQTAEAIIDGLRTHGIRSEYHGSRPELAAPYLPDPHKSHAHSYRLGLDSLGFIQAWFHGDMDRSLADDPRQAARQLLLFLWYQWQRSPGFHLHVSHDWNILLLVWTFMGVPPSQASWPGFLEGLLITFGREGFHFHFRDLNQTTPLPAFAGGPTQREA